MEINMKSAEEKKVGLLSKEVAVKVFAAVGLFAILIVIIFGAALTVNYAGRGLTAAVTLLTGQSPDEEVIPMTDVKKVASGESFTLSWDHKKKASNGSYSLYYPCIDNVFIIVDTVDEGKKTANCNKQFEFVNRGNELSLIASNSGPEPETLPLSISFTPNGESESTLNGVIAIEIINGKVATISENKETNNKDSTPKEVIRYVPVQTIPSYQYPTNTGARVDNPNGLPDLRVTFIETGVLDSANNFSRSSTLSRSDYKIAVRFRVENIGDKSSLPYRFNAYLPTYPAQTYNSDEKPGLAPGGSVDYTVGFNRAVEGNTAVRILIDGGNYITESNESNNELTIPIRVL